MSKTTLDNMSDAEVRAELEAAGYDYDAVTAAGVEYLRDILDASMFAGLEDPPPPGSGYEQASNAEVVSRLSGSGNVVDLADFREVPGIVWVNYKARCTSCGHEHVATQEMPEWAKAPTSAECPACRLPHSCLPTEWLP